MNASVEQSNTLLELETRIERGIETFIDVGNALTEIRDTRLYREAGYTTFEHYCNKRWAFKQSRAYQLMDAARVAQAISSESSTMVELPVNERQARELARLKEPELIREVWEDARAQHGDELTAKDLRQATDRKLGVATVPSSIDEPASSPSITTPTALHQTQSPFVDSTNHRPASPSFGLVQKQAEGPKKSGDEKLFESIYRLWRFSTDSSPEEVAQYWPNKDLAFGLVHNREEFMQWVERFIDAVDVRYSPGPRKLA